MDLETTWNGFDGQAWRLAFRGDSCRTTLGQSTFDRWDALIQMAMAGLTQPLTGWPVLEEWPMHGLKIPLNGMIQTVMAVVTNPSGTTADVCPAHPGTSVGPSSGGDRWGCPDTDGDGWSNLGDAFIHEPTQWRDTDGVDSGTEPLIFYRGDYKKL